MAGEANGATHGGNSSSDPMLQLSSDADFHYEILRTMAVSSYEGADAGEVLVAANKIKPGDMESYYKAFSELAQRVDKQAQAIDSRKYPVSARNAYFKASTYYRSADFFLHGNWSDPRINDIWDQQRRTFDAALGLMSIPGQRINLNATDDSFYIPTIFYSSGMAGPRPTLLMCNGYDGSQEEMYHVIGQAALQRGINVITFEGPGHPTVRRDQDLGFIPEWEKVVTPVVDYALTLPEVDAGSIGLLGYSFGGVLVPRAANFDHRIAAIIADDGLYDFGESLLGSFPPELRSVFNSGNETLFNNILFEALASQETPTKFRWAIQQGMWAFKAPTPFEWASKAKLFNLNGLTSNITAAAFVGDAENDQFFAGQPKILAEHLGDKATFHRFRNSEGAGEHCSVGGSVLANQVILDWYEKTVSKENACK